MHIKQNICIEIATPIILHQHQHQSITEHHQLCLVPLSILHDCTAATQHEIGAQQQLYRDLAWQWSVVLTFAVPCHSCICLACYTVLCSNCAQAYLCSRLTCAFRPQQQGRAVTYALVPVCIRRLEQNVFAEVYCTILACMLPSTAARHHTSSTFLMQVDKALRNHVDDKHGSHNVKHREDVQTCV